MKYKVGDNVKIWWLRLTIDGTKKSLRNATIIAANVEPNVYQIPPIYKIRTDHGAILIKEERDIFPGHKSRIKIV